MKMIVYIGLVDVSGRPVPTQSCNRITVNVDDFKPNEEEVYMNFLSYTFTPSKMPLGIITNAAFYATAICEKPLLFFNLDVGHKVRGKDVLCFPPQSLRIEKALFEQLIV